MGLDRPGDHAADQKAELAKKSIPACWSTASRGPAGDTPLSPVTDQGARPAGTGVRRLQRPLCATPSKGDRDGGSGPASSRPEHDVTASSSRASWARIHDWSPRTRWTRSPTSSAHDNLTAWDKLLQSVPRRAADELKPADDATSAALTLLTAQGTVFVHSGQEMCRTKQGHHEQLQPTG
jgi:hypothetical protein